MKKLLALIVTLSFNFSYAKSLEWQKMELEKDIRDRYSDIATSVINSEEFFTQVEVKYNDPGMPDFKDMNQDDFRISDVQFDDSKGDYIAFSKVGLEVPVVGKAFKENQRKLKEMYRYNESYDLFKNIQSIDVTVSISDAVSKTKEVLVKNLLKEVKLSVVNFVPTVKFKSVKIKEIANLENQPKNGNIGVEEVLEFIGKFGNAIGMILAVAILGFLAFKLLKMYMEFMERIAAMAKPEEPRSDSDDDKSPEHQMMQAGGGDDSSEELPTFDKFEDFLENNFDQSIILIKKWISRDDDNAKYSLSGVAQQLDNAKLESLFNRISSEERDEWNLKFMDFFEGEELNKANKIISEEVVKELIGGMEVQDYELVELILKMNDKMIKDYVLESEKFGHYLSSIISPAVFSRLMNKLTSDEVDFIIKKSLEVTPGIINEQLGAFKEDLKSFSEGRKTSPFSTKLLQSISNVSVEKEEVLYQYLANNLDVDKIVSIAKNYIPGVLVKDLPEQTLQGVLKTYPLSNKVELLSTLTEEEKDKFLNTIAAKGTSAREVIEMEMESVMDDQIAHQKLKNKKDEIWSEFVGFTRKSLVLDSDLDIIENLVSEWISSLSGNQFDVDDSQVA